MATFLEKVIYTPTFQMTLTEVEMRALCLLAEYKLDDICDALAEKITNQFACEPHDSRNVRAGSHRAGIISLLTAARDMRGQLADVDLVRNFIFASRYDKREILRDAAKKLDE